MLQKHIQITNDGWPTFFIPELNETYHSKFGARTESEYVYIKQGLEFCNKKNITVFEFGFGTGLNALLSYLYAINNEKNITYITVEAFPIDITEIKSVEELISNSFEKNTFNQIHTSNWNSCEKLHENFSIHKIHSSFFDLTNLPHNIDVVFFDAFAPTVQPELWSKDVFETIFKSMSNNGVLTTYCAKGEVRRTLNACGFKTERLPGPPGKREMLRAVK